MGSREGAQYFAGQVSWPTSLFRSTARNLNAKKKAARQMPDGPFQMF
jgi:hypothetical protein